MTEQEMANLARVRDAQRRGGLASALLRRARLEASAPDDLVAFDPGPAVGPHDDWIDSWREARARYEAERRA